MVGRKEFHFFVSCEIIIFISKLSFWSNIGSIVEFYISQFFGCIALYTTACLHLSWTWCFGISIVSGSSASWPSRVEILQKLDRFRTERSKLTWSRLETRNIVCLVTDNAGAQPDISHRQLTRNEKNMPNSLKIFPSFFLFWKVGPKNFINIFRKRCFLRLKLVVTCQKVSYFIVFVFYSTHNTYYVPSKYFRCDYLHMW